MKKRSDESSEPEPLAFSRPTPSVTLAFLWGIGFIILGVGLWQYGPVIAKGYNVLLPYGFGVLLVLLGLATLWSCLYQLALRRIPAAIVNVHSNRFSLGAGNSVTLIQPGAVSLSYLRLRLVCIEQKSTSHKRASRGPSGQLESYTKTSEKTLHQQILFEVADLHVKHGDKWQKTESFSIPADAKPSREGASISIVWRLEISGKGGLLTRFLHQFEVQVRP